jgi:hypothetical protein
MAPYYLQFDVSHFSSMHAQLLTRVSRNARSSKKVETLSIRKKEAKITTSNMMKPFFIDVQNLIF